MGHIYRARLVSHISRAPLVGHIYLYRLVSRISFAQLAGNVSLAQLVIHVCPAHKARTQVKDSPNGKRNSVCSIDGDLKRTKCIVYGDTAAGIDSTAYPKQGSISCRKATEVC